VADERRCNYICETTGGLRPPLLAVHTFAHRKSRFFTVVRTMCTRSGGCQPAVVRESRLGGQSAHIRSRSSHAAPRAAGVSPPWLGKRTCNADTAHVRGHSSRAKARAAGVGPPWFGERTCKNASAKWRETADGVLTNVGAIAIPKPRRVTPPAYLRARLPADGIATFAMHERTFVKSGGRQPAVARGTHLQRHFRNYSRDCLLCTDERRCNHGSETTGGLRPPLLAVHTFAHRKSRFFTVVRTMCTRSSGCEPAVVRESRLGGQSAHIRSRSSHAAPRAAGVSPP